MDYQAQYHVSGRLLWGLVAIQRASQAGPLIVASITGVENSMANITSRSFVQKI